MNKKYVAPIYMVGTWELEDALKKLQPEDCKAEMEKVSKHFISCQVFSSSAERSFAKDVFENAWRLSRQYQELE